MEDEEGQTSVSFPVTVWYAADTGHIHMMRRTDPEHETVISPDARAPDGHAELYFALLQLLMETGAPPVDLRRPAHLN